MDVRTPPLHLRDARGFSFIELLVVLMIIGILAAIALPHFLGQTTRAEDRDAMIGASTAQLAMELRYQEHDTYASTAADLIAVAPALQDVVDLQATGTKTTYEVSVRSTASDGGGRFTIERRPDGRLKRTCEHPGRGGCQQVADAGGNRW